MKTLRSATLFTALSALALFFIPSFATPACGSCAAHAKKPAPDAVTYDCPMCPGQASNKPGKCSKCGMFLEAKAAEKVVYSCPMKECAESKAEPGKCSKCGMNLEKKSEKIAYEYACPMKECNEVKEKPGKCSKCGMFLEARPKAAPATTPADDHAGHKH